MLLRSEWELSVDRSAHRRCNLGPFFCESFTLATKNPVRYLELADAITQNIRSGVYAVGNDLPTESQFCEQYGISRFTVREALRRIEAAGLIVKQQGRGSRVTALQPPASFVMIGQSEEDVLRYASGTQVELRKRVKVSETIARKLDLGDPDDWVGISGVRWVPGTAEPIAVLTIYIRSAYAAVLDGLDGPLTGALFPRLVEHGDLHLTQIEQLISAVNMPPASAAKLGCEAYSPALQVIRRFSAIEADPFEVTISWHAKNFELALSMEPNIDSA